VSWWNRSEQGQPKPWRLQRARRRKAAQNTQSTERLEPRVVLGSLSPTETGTIAGSLLPVEMVDFLTPAERQDIDVGDLALLEAEHQHELVREKLAWLEQLRARQDAGIEGEADSEKAENAEQTEEEGKEETQTSRSDDQTPVADTEADGDEVSPDELAELKAETPAESEGESEEESASEKSESDADGDLTEDGSEEESTERTHNEGSAPISDRAEGYSPGSAPAQVSSVADGAAPNAGLAPVEGGDGFSAADLASFFASNNDSGDLVYAPPTAAALSSFDPNADVDPVQVRYDFRDLGQHANQITAAEQAVADAALQAWTTATNGRLEFVRDTEAPASEIINLGKGDLAAFSYESEQGGTLAIGGGTPTQLDDGSIAVTGVAWLDAAETWDTQIGNATSEGDTFDAFTVFAHEIGHTLGAEDAASHRSGDIMNGIYDAERDSSSIDYAVQHHGFAALNPDFTPSGDGTYEMHAMITGYPQLTAGEVEGIIDFATAISPSDDAIIAVVDRSGNILGVRTEDGVSANVTGNPEVLAFAIDGAVAKARTAAFFANGDPVNGTFAPITSRLVRFISQSTVSYREVASNPNVLVPGSTVVSPVRTGTLPDGTPFAYGGVTGDTNFYGPGLVAPIGLGGHFPPEIEHTPPVDLFHIEQTNRDSSVHPGSDGIKGTGDDIVLTNRFDIDPAFVPTDTDGDGTTDNDVPGELRIGTPDSWGFVSGVYPDAQARGIATLPGGVPLYRDTNGDTVGETLIGGIGVFFPGENGTAEFEQGFAPGQTEAARTNASRVLEAEFIAVVAANGSNQLNALVAGTKPAGHPVPDLDIPFGRLDLVGIQLQVIGPTAGLRGARQLVEFSHTLGDIGNIANVNGTPQDVLPGIDYRDGQTVPFGWLVTPHDGANITAAEVQQIIEQGIAQSESVRAAIRLPLGSRTRMMYAVTDLDGEILGLFRQRDATIFSIDVAVSKARNVAYYADTTVLDPLDQVTRTIEASTVPAGTAFTNRTIRFLAEPNFPSGVDASVPGDFSILHDLSSGAAALGQTVPAQGKVNKTSLVEFQGPIPHTEFDLANGTVAGLTSFFPSTNMRDPDNPEHTNGVIFFPGSTPIYDPVTGDLIAGFGVSGDGVDQDDVVTYNGAAGFLPPDAVLRADEVFVEGVRLPYAKFLRNPLG
jgi:uncharacterized protein GlcG (DUF336 family)